MRYAYDSVWRPSISVHSHADSRMRSNKQTLGTNVLCTSFLTCSLFVRAFMFGSVFFFSFCSLTSNLLNKQHVLDSIIMISYNYDNVTGLV